MSRHRQRRRHGSALRSSKPAVMPPADEKDTASNENENENEQEKD